jgi:adenosine deaminase
MTGWASRIRGGVMVLAIGLASLWPMAVWAQTAALTPGEARATRAFEAAKNLGTADLYAFLKPMPKGADLHMHLGGAVYAETFLDEAVRQGLCIDPVGLKFARGAGNDACAPGTVPASTTLTDQGLYDRLIDAFSMRSFVPTDGWSGHDHFFAAFRMGGVGDHTAEWLDEVATRAASQNEQYLEVMASTRMFLPEQRDAITWPADADKTVSPDQLAKMRDALLAAGLLNQIPAGRRQLDEIEAALRAKEGCAGKSEATPACGIKIRYLYAVSRALPPQQVFASTLVGFEVASIDPRVLGINFLAPEDGRVSMKDYHIQMLMLNYLHQVYPKVRITLHAGELAPGLVPPEGLRSHIREAVELGHAARIGHGVDVLYEDDAAGLLREMAARHVMVEISLTSNDVILGVKGADHPLSGYRAAHVPVALSTDDEGVSRINLTHEYVKGAEDQHLSYVDLKQMARTSLEHAFLPGESLWAAPDDFRHRKPACAAPIAAASKPTEACLALLKGSERAAQQWEMERRFAIFEQSVP